MNYYIIPGLKLKEAIGKGSVSLKTLAELTCDYFGMNEADFFSKETKREYAEVRYYFMYIARKSYGHTLADIGRLLNRNHSTVIHGLRTLEDLRFSQDRVSDEINELKMYINKRL